MGSLFKPKSKPVPAREPIPKPEEKPPVEMPVDEIVERGQKREQRRVAASSRRNRTSDQSLGGPNTVMSDYRGGRR